MKQGIVFILTGLISVSVMTAVGFFVKTSTAPVQNEATGDFQLQQAYVEREATYQALIADANQRLEQANADMQALSDRVVQLQQSQPAEAESSSDYPISADRAKEIANSMRAGEKPGQSADLVEFEGSVAYEVMYDNGPVYVDATNGSVLYNSLDDSSSRQITLDEAVKIASDYLGIYEIYQVDQITSNGRILIRVIFSQGHMVYLDQTGQIVYVQKVTRYDASNAVSISSSSDDGGSSSSSHHDDDDDDDDDDD